MLRAPLLLLLLLSSATEPPPLLERAEAFVAALNSGDVARINKTMWAANATTGRKRISRLTLDRVKATIGELREDAITMQVHDASQRLVDEYEVRFTLEENEWRITSLVSTSAHLDPHKAEPTLPLVRELLYRAAEALEEGKVDVAEANYTTARQLAAKLGHLGFQATSERGLANVNWTRGNPAESSRHLEKSVELSRAANDRAGVARSLLGLAQNDDTAGEYVRAEERLREAYDIFRETGNNLLAAYALNYMGTGRAARSDYKEAQRFYEQALQLYEQIGDVRGTAAVLTNLGINHQVQGGLRESIALFRRALEVNRSIDALSGVLIAHSNLGVSLMLQGNYIEALQAFDESLALSDKLGRSETTIGTLEKVGAIYRRLGDYDQARSYFERALILAEKSGAKPAIASATQSLADLRLESGEARGATSLFDKAIALQTELGNRSALGRALESLGAAHLQLRDREAARAAFERSFAIAEEINDRELMASALVRRASIADSTDAIALAERAVAIADEIALPEEQWQAHLGLGRAYRKVQRDAEARTAIERAVAIVEELRRGLPGEEMTRQQAFENLIAPYHELVSLLVAQRENGAALEYAERAKARVLLDVLRYGRPDVGSALTAEEKKTEARLAVQLAEVNREYRKALVAGKANAALSAKLRKARLESDRFITTLYAAHPQLRIESGEVEPITATHFRAMKDADAFVEFVVTDAATYRFTISGGAISVATIPIGRQKLHDEVLAFRELLAERDLAYAKAGRTLYERLFGNAKLKGTLCIVPDGPLWELPFQALQPSASEFLLDRHAIFLAPSLTVLREMSAAPRSRAASRLLAFGFPNALAPLPQSETEVRRIAALYGAKNSRVYLRGDAREEVVKAEAGSYDVLHFATHGVLDDRNALYSRLVFSPPSAKNEDGLLEAREIMRLDLRARLAVLSACETARGRVGEGEGLIGMSWALFVAGAPSSVVSQWKVDSTSTTDLMIEFHRGLRVNGRSNAEALRRAALHVRAKHKHPFYWAPFVVIGR
jgi:CHAT domain-containing protein/Tfp pilus assembly protein PilF